MAQRIGQYTLRLNSKPAVVGHAAVVGKKEGEGPLARTFDHIYEDTLLGQRSWEKAETQMQVDAMKRAMQNARLQNADLDYVFAGDLLNQCLSSSFAMRGFGVPFLGQYSACATMAQTLALAAVFVDSGAARHSAAVTSSHFCSAERQFRFPLEYGGQRPPTAQWTATASGALVVGAGENRPFVDCVTVGKIVDYEIRDASNMGAAMAPSCADTILNFFRDTGEDPASFDMILTGDLAKIGSELLYILLEREGLELQDRHTDCGLLLYGGDDPEVNAGGSGCGCSAAVLCSYVMQKMESHELRNVLFAGTGAMMSLTSSQQGETIPGVTHVVKLCI